MQSNTCQSVLYKKERGLNKSQKISLFSPCVNEGLAFVSDFVHFMGVLVVHFVPRAKEKPSPRLGLKRIAKGTLHYDSFVRGQKTSEIKKREQNGASLKAGN